MPLNISNIKKNSIKKYIKKAAKNLDENIIKTKFGKSQTDI